MNPLAPHPSARGLLVWMQTHPEALHAHLAREAERGGDLGPAGDGAVRAQLAFVAEAIAANAAPGAADGLGAFAAGLADLLTARGERVEDERERLEGATSVELDLQFGDEASEDPSIHSMVQRRIRIAAWTRVFLDALDEARPDRAPIAGPVVEWMAGHQDRLADTIFAMDRRAKQFEIDQGGADAVANAEVVNRIGQAAMLQAHTRFLVEGIAQRL